MKQNKKKQTQNNDKRIFENPALYYQKNKKEKNTKKTYDHTHTTFESRSAAQSARTADLTQNPK